MSIQGLDLAKACANAAFEIRADDIRVIDLSGLSTVTDYMVLCSGNSAPHLKAVLREVKNTVRDEHGVTAVYAEGNTESRWVVLDYVDVMVHIIDEELREHYSLEKLWSDGKEVEIDGVTGIIGDVG